MTMARLQQHYREKVAPELMAKFGKNAGKADSAAAHTAESDAVKAAEGDAARTAEGEGAKKPGEGEGQPKNGESGYKSAAEREAEKAEEFAEALAVSRAILRAEDAGRVPGPTIAASLETLKARYRWIKAFVAEPLSRGFEVFLIASKEGVGKTGQTGGTESGNPGAREFCSADEFEVRAQAQFGGAKGRLPISKPRPGGGMDVEVDLMDASSVTQIKRITSPDARFGGKMIAQFQMTMDAAQLANKRIVRYVISSEAPEAFLADLRAQPVPAGIELVIEQISALK